MRALLILVMLATLSGPAMAQAFDTPEALVNAIYQRYQAGASAADPTVFYSERLKRLTAEHAERAAEGPAAIVAEGTGEPAVEFDPFIDGQSALLLDVTIGTPLVMGDRALVTVGFHNFDQPTLLSLSLLREADGWRVDDVTSTGGEENWMLSWLLQFDPWGL